MHSRRSVNAAILGAFLGVSIPAQAVDVWTSRSGNWSDPTIWVSSSSNPAGAGTPLNRLPTAADDVLIRLGHTITVDVTSATARILDIGYIPGGFGTGNLVFSTSTNSTLAMTGTLYVNTGGSLTMGTAANPMPAGVTARLLLAPTDAAYHGLYLYVNSSFSAHGASKVPVAVVPGPVSAPATSFSVPSAQVAGWRVGDVITLANRDDEATYENQTEERTIISTAPSGGNTIISWSGALLHDHVGGAGVRVANLTRNVVVRSSSTNYPDDTSFFRFNGAGARTMSMASAEFAYLGNNWDASIMGLPVSNGTSISSCSFHHSGSGLLGASDMSVSGNVFYANHNGGILFPLDYGQTWHGNDILHNDFMANSSAIVYHQGQEDGRIVGNHVYSNVNDGLVVGGDGILVSQNHIHNNGHGPGGSAGLKHEGGKAFVSSNTVAYNSDIGLHSQNGMVMVANRVYGNGWNGVLVNNGVIAVSNEIYQNGNQGVEMYGRPLIIKGHVYLNGGIGLFANGESTGTVVETAVGYDAAGASLPNVVGEVWMYQNSHYNRPTLFGCRVNPAGWIGYDAPDSGILAYNLNHATGTVRAMGRIVIEPGESLVMDRAQPLWRAWATSPVLMKGQDHAAFVRSVSDANAVSQLIVIRYDGAQWRVEGSESGLMYGPFTGVLSNQNIAGQFTLDFTPDVFTAAREDDRMAFALIASSKDAGVQKKLLFTNNGWGTGGSDLWVTPGSTFTLRGVAGELATMDLDAGASHPYFFTSSGTLTLENAGVLRISEEGLWLSGSGAVSITSTSFNTIGAPNGAYITAGGLTSSAVFRNLSFDPGTPDPNFPLSVRVVGADAGLNWVMEGFSGNRGGDAFDFDPNQRIYWAGSSPVGTPGGFSAAVFADGLSLSWAAPSRPPVFYRGSYRLYASTNSAAGPFALVASPSASTTTFVHMGLLPETTYFYRLEASDLADTVSAVAATASALTGDFSQPELTASVGARTVGVAWSQAAMVTFNKGMNTASVSGAVSLLRLKDNLGNVLSPPAVVPVSVSPDFSGSIFTVTPSSALAGNSVYELHVSTGARDLLNQPVSSSSTLRFTTLMDRSVRNVVTEGTLGALVDVPAGALAADGYALGGSAPLMTTDATRKLIANTGDSLRSPVLGSMEDLKMYDGAGALQAFSAPVTVTLSYPDLNADGIVDGTTPPVRARTLAVYWLDEAKSVWHRLPSSRVDAAAGTVSADTGHFTTFAAIGQADTDLSGAHAFPNPFVGGGAATAVTFTGLGQISTIRLFTTSGRLVREINVPAGAGVADWDLKNDDGEPVASGLYLYRITSGGSTATGKLGVVR